MRRGFDGDPQAERAGDVTDRVKGQATAYLLQQPEVWDILWPNQEVCRC
jgi:hypothetical protein